ncbi:hypothetical protein K3718_08865 [Leisingera aquaemixtae]|uniref:Uncharacterized protein n=1 Tax=Leisingera aquaemixtae TaxID=1396826 RepID=A0ABY5WNY4_9RHOB|nr:hypothetical protein [Leisingera aquaemixtae]UWQ43178.1 hypothetical protein K3718_08865 [Leisingera aquaemixtae]
MRERVEAIKAWAFPKTMFAQVQVGLLLVLAFLLPFKVGQVLWPSDPENGVMKAVAILIGASTFVTMKAAYGYFSFIMTKRETENEMRGERKQ